MLVVRYSYYNFIFSVNVKFFFPNIFETKSSFLPVKLYWFNNCNCSIGNIFCGALISSKCLWRETSYIHGVIVVIFYF